MSTFRVRVISSPRDDILFYRTYFIPPGWVSARLSILTRTLEAWMPTTPFGSCQLDSATGSRSVARRDTDSVCPKRPFSNRFLVLCIESRPYHDINRSWFCFIPRDRHGIFNSCHSDDNSSTQISRSQQPATFISEIITLGKPRQKVLRRADIRHHETWSGSGLTDGDRCTAIVVISSYQAVMR